jgi:hypothetical protein
MSGGIPMPNSAAIRAQNALRQAKSDAKRLAAADEILAQGDVHVAILIYVRLALTRPANATTPLAKQRLAQLQADGEKKTEELDQKLEKVVGVAAAGADESDSSIIGVFRQFDVLIEKYGELPRFGVQLKGHVSKLRHQDEYAVVLNEPPAAALWKLGRKFERDSHLCCAYWIYKQAAELAPAPSAALAKDRYDTMRQDEKVVASAEVCRELRWCHQAYLRAEHLLKVKPDTAKEIFAEIVRRAPEDSEVYIAAKKEIE